MSRTRSERRIEAPLPMVFETVSNAQRFSDAVPQVVSIEFLTDRRTGAGTRFRETREMGSRKVSNELHVTEYSENEYVRMSSEAGGAIWDSLFEVRRDGDATILALVMEATPQSFLARITTPLMRGMIQRAIEKDMDAVKAYCEGRGADRRGGEVAGASTPPA